jgi:hypothetical protein
MIFKDILTRIIIFKQIDRIFSRSVLGRELKGITVGNKEFNCSAIKKRPSRIMKPRRIIEGYFTSVIFRVWTNEPASNL